MTIFKDYPSYTPINLEDVKEILRTICNIRKDDITQISNLANTFVSGRKVNKIPSGSADVAPPDLVGDMNYDASYLYILVNDSGTAAWRRVAIGAW